MGERSPSYIAGICFVKKPQVGNNTFAHKKRVQEIKQTRLRKLLSKDNLEANVSKRIDELPHDSCHYVIICCKGTH